MGVTKSDAKRPNGINPGIHASEDEVFLRGRQRQMSLRKRGRVAGRSLLDLLLDSGHFVFACSFFFGSDWLFSCLPAYRATTETTVTDERPRRFIAA